MTITVFLKEQGRELVVTNERINLQKLFQVFEFAKTANPENDIVMRDKSKSYPVNNNSITSIKFYSCQFDEEIFVSSANKIIAAIEENTNLASVIFSGQSNIDNEMAEKILKILFSVRSHQVEVDFNHLEIKDGLQKNKIQLMSLYNKQWMKGFQQSWEINLNDDAPEPLREKVASYNKLLAEISLWRFELMLHNANISAYTVQSRDQSFDIVVPLTVINREYKGWYDKADKLIKKIKQLIKMFEDANSADEKNILILTYELLEEVKDLVVYTRDQGVSLEEKVIYARYLKTRETFRGTLQQAFADEKAGIAVNHHEILEVYSDSSSRRSQYASIPLRTISVAVNSLLFSYLSRLRTEKKVTEAAAFYDVYCSQHEVDRFLKELSELPLTKLSTSTIYDIGLRLILLFKLNYTPCMKQYASCNDLDATRLLEALKKLIEGNPHNHASKFIFCMLDGYLKINYLLTNESDEVQAFSKRIQSSVNAILPAIKDTHAVQFGESSCFRNERIDQMHIIMLHFNALRDRLSIEELVAKANANPGSLALRLSFTQEIFQKMAQLRKDTLPANIKFIQSLFKARNNKIQDVFTTYITMSKVDVNLYRHEIIVENAVKAVYASFCMWVSHDEFLDPTDKVQVLAGTEERIAVTKEIYRCYKKILLALPVDYQGQRSFINDVLAQFITFELSRKPPALPAKKSSTLFIANGIEKPAIPNRKKQNKVSLPMQSEPVATSVQAEVPSQVEEPSQLRCAFITPIYPVSIVSDSIVQVPDQLDKLFKSLQYAIPFSQPFVYGEFVATAMAQMFHPELGLLVSPAVKLVMFSNDWDNGEDFARLRQLIPDLVLIDYAAQKFRGTYLNWRVEITVCAPLFFARHEFLNRCYVNVNTLMMTPDGRIWDHFGTVIDDVKNKLVYFLPNRVQFNHPLMLLDLVNSVINLKFSTYQENIEYIKKSAFLLRTVHVATLFQYFAKMFQAGNTLVAFKLCYESGILAILLPEVVEAIHASPHGMKNFEDFFKMIDQNIKDEDLNPLLLLVDIMKIALQHLCNPTTHIITDFVKLKVCSSASPLIISLDATQKQSLIFAVTGHLFAASAAIFQASNASHALFGATSNNARQRQSLQVTSSAFVPASIRQ